MKRILYLGEKILGDMPLSHWELTPYKSKEKFIVYVNFTE